ncbi:MAG: HIT family protein [Bacteroidota bacterium]|nr:HIT family protein [Bacteroidota bacterium]
MTSIFTKIINGEIPSYKVAENDKFYAFLDIAPLQKGHTLVVPKKEEDYFFDIQDEDLQEYICFAKKIAKAIKLAFPCEKVGMAVIGLEVRHAHIHLVPMHKEGDLNFANEKLSLSQAEFENIAKSIADKYNSEN